MKKFFSRARVRQWKEKVKKVTERIATGLVVFGVVGGMAYSVYTYGITNTIIGIILFLTDLLQTIAWAMLFAPR